MFLITNKKSILVLTLVIVLSAVGIYIYSDSLIEEANMESSNTDKIQKEVMQRFQNKYITDYEYTPNRTNLSKNYIILNNYSHTSDDGTSYNAKYNNSLNELNGTQKLLDYNTPLDALVYIQEYHIEKATGEKAYQIAYEINYLDLKSNKIFLKGTIYGEKPKEVKKDTDSGFGAAPSDQQVIDELRALNL